MSERKMWVDKTIRHQRDYSPPRSDTPAVLEADMLNAGLRVRLRHHTKR